MNYTNLQNSFLIDQINNTLNEKQKEAVLVESGPVLVIAGAGSGKTRVLTYRVAYLTGILGIPPHRIFVATFTNKAAQEMKERINSLMGTQVRDLWIGTFHSLCVRILRKEIWRIGYSQNFSIFDRDDQKKVIKDIVGKGERPDRFIHYISRVKTYGEGIEDRFLNSVFEEYTKKMKLLNALDFDDLLVLTLKIFESFPDVKNHYAERFLHILVDEYQDTNRLQYEIIRHLSSKHRNIFVVGDDDQSIYAFRGADLRNILDFEQDFPDARIIRLEQNYRSTKNILKAASTVIAHNRLRKGKTLWTQNPEGKKIVIFECDTEREEAETVAKIIEKSGREYRDFLILYRTNAQSRAFEERFHLEGIPYQIVGGLKFYERQEIKDILAYLRILVNLKDEIALLRIFNVPPRGIGVKTIETVKNYAEMKKVSLLDALKQIESLDLHKSRKEKLQNFFSLITDFKEKSKQLDVYELTKYIIEQTGYMEYLEREFEPEKAEMKKEYVKELLGEIEEFVKGNPGADVEDYIHYTSLLTDIDEFEEKENTVTMMTVHNAKGLEYPVVIITGLEEGVLPHIRSMGDPNEIEEERRLFHVALTRAKEEVYITYSRLRYFKGERYLTPSRFLEELPEDVVVHLGRGLEKLRYENKYREMIPEMDEETLAPGDIVMHSLFGRGKVLEVYEGKAKVHFDYHGIKILVLEYAKLKKVN